MQNRRVVITGQGVVSSLGHDTKTFWENLCEGKSGISNIESFDTTGFDVHFAGEIKDFDPEKYIDRKNLRRCDRFSQFSLVAGIEAVNDAGLDFSREDPYRVGVLIGSGIGGLIEMESQHKRLLNKGPSKVSPFMIPKLMINAASGQVSIHFGIKGPNSATVSACASGANAIGDAYEIIANNQADIMVTGGTEAAITPLGVSGFCSMKALSTRNDAPQKASRPFDRDRDGFVLGEGAGVLVLEEYEHAKKRNATIYAEICGYGMSGDSYHIAAPDPDGIGAMMSMKKALQSAQINPEDVGYINAHGTSTPLGDISECKAVKMLFKDWAYKLAISSTKSMIGHLLGASGGIELVVCALTLKNKTFHPTINYEHQDPECDLDFVPNVAREGDAIYVLSNSFGFGGHNATLVLKKV